MDIWHARLRKGRVLSLVCGLVLVGSLAIAQNASPVPRRDINAVLAAHDKALLAIPGVVGVYVGTLDGGTPCLKVMLAEKNVETERQVPPAIEGYAVVTEVTGEIRPLN